MRTSGLISSTSSANPNSTLPRSSDEILVDNYTNGRTESGIQSAEEVASAVWKFFGAAGSLIDGLDKDDDLRLLRLRTKKNELVIVPGTIVTSKLKAPLTERQILTISWS